MDWGLPLLEKGRAMSEYQYYEFRAVDRPLDERDLRMLRSASTTLRWGYCLTCAIWRRAATTMRRFNRP